MSPFSGVWSSGGGVPPPSAVAGVLTGMGRSVGEDSMAGGGTAKENRNG